MQAKCMNRRFVVQHNQLEPISGLGSQTALKFSEPYYKITILQGEVVKFNSDSINFE
jgi:hypothetical protein